jgi:hypothetical protein
MTWVKTEGRARCSSCGALVRGVLWRWLTGPASYTHEVCEPCVERLLKEEK